MAHGSLYAKTTGASKPKGMATESSKSATNSKKTELKGAKANGAGNIRRCPQTRERKKMRKHVVKRVAGTRAYCVLFYLRLSALRRS